MTANPELSYRMRQLLSVLLIQLVWAGSVLPASLLNQETDSPLTQTVQSKSPHAKSPPPTTPTDHAARIRALGQLPMSFEANRGQTNSQVRFLARGSGYGLFLTEKEAVMVLRKSLRKPGNKAKPNQSTVVNSTMRMQFVGGNPQPRIGGLDEISSRSNYFFGSDRTHWQTNVASFAKVKYEEIYPGIDLIYYGNQQQLEYDFVLAPGADIDLIRLRFKGADKLKIDGRGDLVLQTKGGEVRQSKPKLYQEKNGSREEVAGSYVLLGKRDVGFQVGDYDRDIPLVIDPVLVYSTFLGGNGSDATNSIVADANGNTYITGQTASTNFPTANPFDGASNGGSSDAFIAKMNAAGNALIYSTYLGGSGDDYGYDVAIDSAGNAYVTGRTSSSDFPTATPVQANFAGETDFFIAKLDVLGSSLVFSTYLGGASYEFNPRIAIDSFGNSYVTGQTASTNFPTANALQSSKGAGLGYDAFITKLDSSGSAYVYSTFLGGSAGDYGTNIVVGPAGQAYISGYTESPDFPIANALQPMFGGGADDAFTAQINSSGSALVYSTYLGGTDSEAASSIALDADGNTYLAGRTSSANFPSVNPLQATYGGGSNDAFLTKLAANGTSIIYSTYLGGNGYDFASDLVVDASANVFLTGYTASPNFPTANPIQAAYGGGGFDAFVSKINSAGSALSFSSYFGGSNNDFGYGIAVDTAGNIYLAGNTASTNFPTANPWQPARSGSSDAFLAKISGLDSSYGISGRVTDGDGNGLASVTINLSGSQTGSTETNSSGNYNFTNLATGGNYTVTPSSPVYSFSPANRTFNSLSQNQQANFTAAVITYSISGRIADANGIGLAGATVELSGSDLMSTVSDGNGNYLFASLTPGGDYTITPSKTTSIYTYLFAPPSQTLTSLSANQTVNFTSTLVSQISLNAIADAYVRDGSSANTNFGGANRLDVRTDAGVNNGLNRHAYLKFDLSSITSPITNARLSVFAALSSSGSVTTSVYPVANTTWLEQGTGGIRWNNKPALGGSPITGANAIIGDTSYATYEIDVTSYIQAEKNAGRDLVTLALRNPTASTLMISLNSREASAQKPQLIVVTNNSDNVSPNVTLTGPANGTNYNAPANVTLTANASDADGTVSRVDFFAGTALIGSATTPVSGNTFSITWSNVPSGSYLLSVVATDNKGASTGSNFAGISVLTPNTPPTISLTSPTGNANFAAGSNISLAANANDIDGSITKVEFFHGGTNKIGESLTAPYALTWTNVPAAGYSLTAKATDNTGAVTTSAPVSITVTAAPGSGEIVFVTGKTLGTLRNNLSNFAGMKITVGAAAIRVTQLGRIFVTGNSGTHTLKIVTATDGLDVAGGSVSLAMPGGTAGQFKYARLANPVLLKPNTAYYIVSQETSGGDQWYDSNTALTTTAAATVNSGIYRNGSTWTTQGTANRSFVPVDFKYHVASAVYRLHKEASSTASLFQLKTAAPDGTALALRTADLRSQPTGEKLIKAFDTQAGVPNTAGVIPAGSTVTFTLWMKKTASQGTMFPRVKLNLNSSSGASLCMVTGTTALTTTLTKYTLTGTTTAPINVAPTDRFYLWTGVNLTVASSSAAFMGELDVEGVANGNYDSLINAPLPLPPNISSLSPATGQAGTSLTVNGSEFGTTQGTSSLSLNNQPLTVSSWSNTSIVAVIPNGAGTGPVVITVMGLASNEVTFTVGIVDSDGDGLADSWEMQFFGNLAQTSGGDPDGDGQTNLQEYLAGRNPTKGALADSGGAVDLKIHTPLKP